MMRPCRRKPDALIGIPPETRTSDPRVGLDLPNQSKDAKVREPGYLARHESLCPRYRHNVWYWTRARHRFGRARLAGARCRTPRDDDPARRLRAPATGPGGPR